MDPSTPFYICFSLWLQDVRARPAPNPFALLQKFGFTWLIGDTANASLNALTFYMSKHEKTTLTFALTYGSCNCHN